MPNLPEGYKVKSLPTAPEAESDSRPTLERELRRQLSQVYPFGSQNAPGIGIKLAHGEIPQEELKGLAGEAALLALPAAAARVMRSPAGQAILTGAGGAARNLPVIGRMISGAENAVIQQRAGTVAAKRIAEELAAEQAVASQAAPAATKAAAVVPEAVAAAEAAPAVARTVAAPSQQALAAFGREAAARNPKIGEKIWVLLDDAGNPVKVLTPDQAGAAKRAGEATTWIRNIWQR